MSYVTHIQLAENPGARELAQVATARHLKMVAPELMEATLRNTDRSAWTADEVAVADDALQRIDEAITNADGLIDGFLQRRGYLPLLEKFGAVPGIVSTWSRAITRYLLHKDRINSDERTDPIVRDYRDALKMLQLTADGKFSLGADDDSAIGSAGSPIWHAPERQFTNKTLDDF